MKGPFTFTSRTIRHDASMTMSDLTEVDSDRAAAAALLRRSSLAPRPARIDALAGSSWDDMVDEVLDIATMQAAVEAEIPVTDERQDLLRWWMESMSGPDSGIVDRMTWFWHGHLTTNEQSVDNTVLITRQMSLLRTNSMGNYRDLLQGFVIDGALLYYLDGAGSQAHNPNENLARELMELFSIGRGNYSQDDVRAAARALAGWWIDDDEENEDDPQVRFDRSNAFVAPLVFMGEQDDWDTERLVDRLCDHPGTAVNVSSKLWYELVGTELGTDEAVELGSWWQEADLEILPLVERILHSDDARDARYTRARTGLEWFVAAKAVAGFEFDNIWTLHDLGQMPYHPPNVAGWPKGDRWLRPGSLAHRAVLLGSLPLDDITGTTTDDVLAACGIESVSDTTRRALELAGDADELAPEQQAVLRWRLALNAPEFHLS